MVSINVQESVAVALAEQAKAEGLTLDQYLERLASFNQPEVSRPTGDELMRRLDEASVDGSTASCKYTRADIYDDHD